MQIGKTIRKYRKEKGMTQEEMANRLGVTTPAVNKWENENSYPDISLLPPIARLLEISLDTLLSFQEELTKDEIASIVIEINQKLKLETYDEVFQWAKSIIESYPNCLMLIWQLATILDANRLFTEVPNTTNYDAYILKCYNRVLESKDETLRTSAADSLFGYYLRNEQYDAAEKYLQYYSMQNPLRKLKPSVLHCYLSEMRHCERQRIWIFKKRMRPFRKEKKRVQLITKMSTIMMRISISIKSCTN